MRPPRYLISHLRVAVHADHPLFRIRRRLLAGAALRRGSVSAAPVEATTAADPDRTIIRIKSARSLPEKIVFDTSPQAEAPIIAQTDPLPEELRQQVREAWPPSLKHLPASPGRKRRPALRRSSSIRNGRQSCRSGHPTGVSPSSGPIHLPAGGGDGTRDQAAGDTRSPTAPAASPMGFGRRGRGNGGQTESADHQRRQCNLLHRASFQVVRPPHRQREQMAMVLLAPVSSGQWMCPAPGQLLSSVELGPQ